MSVRHDRRGFFRRCGWVAAGAAAGAGLEERLLLAQAGTSRAAASAPAATTGAMPTGKLGKATVSRLILGGNLIGGVGHSRDLKYVSALIRHYFTDEKIMDTWQAAEESGINTMSAWPSAQLFRVLKRYRQERGGTIQWIGHTNYRREAIQSCIDSGAVGVYVCGDPTDTLVKTGRLDTLGEALSFIRRNGAFAGIACHEIRVLEAMEAAGISGDFVMKTIHHDRYWSAPPKEKRERGIRIWDPDFKPPDHASGYYHDNIWCRNAEATTAHMQKAKIPWMAFKVLAAGAIHPRDGFRYAFESGADFIHVGMFDFQVREDAIITNRVLSGKLNRTRPWRA
jgi:hypothetical protein